MVTNPIEIKHGQDNVELVNQLVLDNLYFQNLSKVSIDAFFKENYLCTKVNDFRSLHHAFQIIGSCPLGVIRLFTLTFKRSLYKRESLKEGMVAFDVDITETPVSSSSFDAIISVINRSDLVTSPIVFHNFEAKFQERSYEAKANKRIRKLHTFRFATSFVTVSDY